MNGENHNAINFLRQFAPDRPWVLTAIELDRKSIHTKTFNPITPSPHKLDDFKRFLVQNNGVRNIYFQVNPLTRTLTKKASRTDIQSLAWLHVDIDPRAGENIDDEQARIHKLLTTKLPKGVPPPTAIIFSGGGYQGFWKLETPLPINGELEAAEEAKRYNLQLELLFKADNCHNIDRIMRLPGTINLPDAKKAKAGRKPQLARLVSFDDSRIYPLSAFSKSAQVQAPEMSGFGLTGKKVKLENNIPKLNTIDELDQWEISDRLKIIAVQGKHPDEVKKGDDSRSAWVFDFCCNLVRRNVPDEVIFSVLMDPDFGISESILELGTNATKYAMRQIERAKEEADNPALRQLNEKYAVIQSYGSKCRIVYEVFDPVLGRPELVAQGVDDFSRWYGNKKVQIGEDDKGVPKFAPLGKWWFYHPDRRGYQSIIFAPNKDITGHYNLWKGYGCQDIPGECGRFLGHIKHILCNDNEEYYQYLINWLARTVQFPDCPGEVAIILRGGRGTGKSFFAKEVGKIFGRHFMQVSNSNHLVGNFNNHLRDKILLFADEAFWANDKKHESTLKTLVTERTLTIEAKGVDAVSAPNFVHLIMASNDQHVVPAGADERRFFVLDVNPEHQQNTDYFGTIAQEMKNGGTEALLHYLKNVDLSNFDVYKAPETEALKEQKLLSLTLEQAWWYSCLQHGTIGDSEFWPDIIPVTKLMAAYLSYAQALNHNRRSTETSLGIYLKQICPGIRKRRTRVRQEGIEQGAGKQVNIYKLPPLAECRAQWSAVYNIHDWD